MTPFFIGFLIMKSISSSCIATFQQIKTLRRPILAVDDIKCFTFVSGGRKFLYQFNHAHLLMFEDALVICGFTKIGKIKLYKSVIVLANNNEWYKENCSSARFPRIKQFYPHSFNEDVYFDCVEEGIMDSNIELRLEKLTEEQKQYIHI